MIGLISLASWTAAIRLLFFDARLKKFWLVWLALGFLLLLFFGSEKGIWIASVSSSFVFLLFRRYKPYRHLTSRRRAALFLIGLFVLSLLTLGFPYRQIVDQPQPKAQTFVQPENFSLLVNLELNNLKAFGLNMTYYALGSLQSFWFFSLLHLFFGIRLHFMKLRPKLAVSAVLIAVVPLSLVIIMGILTLYSTLGESRASRASTILEEWAELATENEGFIQTISKHYFIYQKKGDQIQLKGDKPSWLSEFIGAFQKKDSLSAQIESIEKAKYFLISSEIWLINLRNVHKPNFNMSACLVDDNLMNRLAKILRSNVRISFSNPITFKKNQEITIHSVKSDSKSKKEISGTFEFKGQEGKSLKQSSKSLWHRSFYFGMSHIDVIKFDSGKFTVQKTLILVENSIFNIIQELLSEKNPMSQAVMIILLFLAVMFLILESFAFFFGVRISTGVTSAIRSLHRGTRRIAKGNLDTRIDIPNEDELGELATSFNEMAAAVKKGRKEALERERLESELSIARKIQEKLLPHKMPNVPGFDIAGTSLPSQQVGGDYFDFLDMETGQLGIAIGDVSGKGIPAALLMANLQASLHAQVTESRKVSEVVDRINNLLVRSTGTNMFATFFYGILDRNQSTFTFCNGGHNPPLLLRTDGSIERFEKGGLLLGFLPDQSYTQQTISIKPGEIIVLYTDGVTEAFGPFGEMISENLFGEEQLITVIRNNKDKSARQIQSAILKAIAAHTANVPQSDDITLVIIKRRQQSD